MATWPTHRAKASMQRYRRRFLRTQARVLARRIGKTKRQDEPALT